MDTDLVDSAQHGDKGAFTTLAAAVPIGSLPRRTGFCATSTSPRMRRSRRCSHLAGPSTAPRPGTL